MEKTQATDKKLKYFLNNRNFQKRRQSGRQGDSSTPQKAPDSSKREQLGTMDDAFVGTLVANDLEEEEKPVTAYTYLTKKQVGNKRRWTKEEEELFIESLECCGCEFSMMNLIFPDRTRSGLKGKFKREMRAKNPKAIKAIKNFKSFDLGRFNELKTRVANIGSE